MASKPSEFVIVCISSFASTIFFSNLFRLQCLEFIFYELLKDQYNRTYGYDAAMPVMCDSKTQIGSILLKESYRKIGSYISVVNPTTAGKDSQNILLSLTCFKKTKFSQWV